MRGDGDIAFLNNFSAVSLGLFRVHPDISPIRGADINEFVHIKKLLSIIFERSKTKGIMILSLSPWTSYAVLGNFF
jgi:hypothetical protein